MQCITIYSSLFIHNFSLTYIITLTFILEDPHHGIVPRGARSTNSQRGCTSPRKLMPKTSLNFIKNRLLNALWLTQGERAVRHNF